MFELVKSFKVSASILALEIYHDKIVMITNQYLFLVYDKHSYELVFKKQISSKFDNKFIYDKTFCISKNLDLFITTSNSDKSFLLKYFDLSIKKMDAVSVSKMPLYCSAYSYDASMLAMGGEDGKLHFYSLEDKRVIASLPAKSDYISSVSFSEDNQYAAISSFDKNITIYSFHYACIIANITTDDVVENSKFILNNSKLLTVSRDKKMATFDIKTAIKAVSSFEFDEWPTVVLTISEYFSVIGTRGYNLYIVNHSEGVLLRKIKLDNIGVTCINKKDNDLYISFVDGEVKVIDMKVNIDKFIIELKLNNFEQASKLIDENIFLAIDEHAQKFDQVWDDTISEAKNLIAHNKELEAKAIVQPFFFNHQREDEFNFCLGKMDDFILFTKLIDEKEYIEAFKLADECEFLKKSKDFDSLEKHFLKIFHHCKLLFSKGDTSSINTAKKTLSEYTQIRSKKALVNNLTTKYKMFILAEKLLKTRKFKEYFLLVKQNRFLEDEEFYNRALLIGSATFNKLNIYIQELNYEKALQIAHYLTDFLPYKEVAEQKIIAIEQLQFLEQRIQNNIIEDVYSIVKKDSTLESNVMFLEYHKIYTKTRRKAHKFALIGDVLSVKEILKEYMNINYLLTTVAHEIKLAYLSQIDKYATDNYLQINWEKTIKLYQSMFGIDSDLLHILDKYKFDSQHLLNLYCDTFDAYKKVGFLDTVVVLNE